MLRECVRSKNRREKRTSEKVANKKRTFVTPPFKGRLIKMKAGEQSESNDE